MTPADAVWYPGPEWFEHSNLAALLRRLGRLSYDEFLELSVDRPDLYWEATLEHLGIRLSPAATAFMDDSEGKPWARFFPGAGFNFAAACIAYPPGAGERTAVSWEDEAGQHGTLSYAGLAERSRRFAAGLQQLGVQPGDRVGFLFPNTIEAVISFVAIGLVGAISVPLYTGFGSEAIARRLTDAGATCLITAHGFTRRGRYVSLGRLAADVRSLVPGLYTCIIVHGAGMDAPDGAHHSWHEVEASGRSAMEPARTSSDDPCMILYTSGTSGKPKGAVHVHAGFPLRVAQDVAFAFDFKAGDRYFWMADMGWMVGPFSMCSVLLNKGTLVLYDGAPDMPSIGRLRDVAARHRVTHFGSSPTAVRAMAADAAAALRSDADDLRVLMTGGEVMDPETHAWFYSRFGAGRLPVINYTGGTEVSGAILTNVVLRPILPSRFNSTAPGVRAAIVDGDGRPVLGIPGELTISQPFVGMARGFWEDRQRYLDAYWSRIPGLWVHGDLAVAEPDGQYLLLGRSDDVMKVAGRRIGPAEVEAVVADGVSVLEAVAVGVPDPRSGEALVLLVVPARDEVDSVALSSHVADRLRETMGAGFRPRAVVPVRRLAKTRNGKLVRRLVRQAWLGEQAGDLSALEEPAIFDEMALACAAHRSASP